jgi:SET domain-containing protein
VIRDIEVGGAGRKGLGVFALRSFARGKFIFRRRNGPPIRYEDLDSVPPERREHLTELDREHCAIVEPPGAYLNHSCEPNAMRSGVKVFAWHNIAAGDEITIDYRLNAFDGDSWPCLCGAQSCSGTVVGSFFALDQETQRAYLPYAPAFIRRENRARRQARL